MDDPSGPTLPVDELVLRPWRPTDAPALVAACQDPDIGRWASVPQPFGDAEAARFLEAAELMWRDGTGAAFAILDPATDRLLGAVTRFGPDGHQSTVGCWVVPEARGHGVGTRAIRAVADHTFATTATLRLDCFIMVGNEGSERMVVRAGFQREGVLRAWDLGIDGVPVDCVAYSRLRSDP